MRILLVAVGTRMPSWVQTGYEEYAKRLPRDCRLELVEIPPAKRARTTPVERLRQAEGERLLAAVPPGGRVLALDERGLSWSTRELAEQLTHWQRTGKDVALLVGGPDGLSDACRERAEGLWSLSRLTLPHAMVRVIVAEQLYRAWSMLTRHPYHRD
ncbi:MAG: 23S rRNA (pseudouridine(1915)-N(3))-methyltransferase RlmH [Gammaproteobacteria bacterium]|nr:23S rRNA (pseudouridine(1915)-N(3))-methyltransferase RlmH [Gammaproteobacteria bacterium]MCP5423990.1 23S rRNA (pseudouridine(1915)-N(3))-methyltransferase RlmH [Gammaproteobacteria bacterium]